MHLSIVHDLSLDNRYSFYEGIVQMFYSMSQRLRRKIVVFDVVVSFQEYFKVFSFLSQWWKLNWIRIFSFSLVRVGCLKKNLFLSFVRFYLVQLCSRLQFTHASVVLKHLTDILSLFALNKSLLNSQRVKLALRWSCDSALRVNSLWPIKIDLL